MVQATQVNERIRHSIQRLVAALEQQQFFGTVELKYEAGRIVLVRKTETIKPEDYRDNRGLLNATDK